MWSVESTWSVEPSKSMLVQKKFILSRRTIDDDEEDSACVVVLSLIASVSLGYRPEATKTETVRSRVILLL